MASNGYFDQTSGTYKALPTETWASYTNWSTFTSWAGTPSDTVTFSTEMFDGGKIDYFNPTVLVNASIPVDITINYGNTADSSGGAIDSPSSVAVVPNTATVAGILARYFQFDITLNRDSATQADPEIFAIDVNLSNQLKQVQQSDLDTSTLAGSVGARQLSFNVQTGKIVNLLIQVHSNTLNEDSAGDSVTPMVFVDKTSSPAVLNIFNIDTYGKRTRIDCVVDVQATTLPLLQTDVDGNLVEVND